jgi:hypothetical protein
MWNIAPVSGNFKIKLHHCYNTVNIQFYTLLCISSITSVPKSNQSHHFYYTDFYLCTTINDDVDLFCCCSELITSTGVNPLPSLTLQSTRDLNVPCQPKRSKALLLSYTFKCPLKKKRCLSAHAVGL